MTERKCPLRMVVNRLIIRSTIDNLRLNGAVVLDCRNCNRSGNGEGVSMGAEAWLPKSSTGFDIKTAAIDLADSGLKFEVFASSLDPTIFGTTVAGGKPRAVSEFVTKLVLVTGEFDDEPPLASMN